jgi:hypothetical protein
MAKSTRHLNVRLYPDEDDDLIDWLEELDELPYGEKGRTIKAALRRNLGQTGDRSADFDAAALEEALQAGIGGVLPQLRRVVEAAVATAMAQANVRVESAPEPEEDAEDDPFFANLEGLMLEGEE